MFRIIRVVSHVTLVTGTACPNAHHARFLMRARGVLAELTCGLHLQVAFNQRHAVLVDFAVPAFTSS